MKITTVTGTFCDNEHNEETAAMTTRRLGLDGRTYEIDVCTLCNFNIDAVMGAVLKNARIVARGRKASKTPVSKRRNRQKRDADKDVRNFWRSHPEVHDGPFQERGRMPSDVLAAYRAYAGKTA